ncbi:MAG: Ig-like domain-containing protein, partial [Eubacterium sp.]|nr:Ig-like domain-containing protein [Eubacterium sp.]
EEATTFVEAKDTVVAKLTITAPTAEEDPEYKPEPKYTYKVAGTSDETYKDEVPTSAGKYTVRAVVADTDKYIGFTKTANFEITAKQQAAGTVAIYIDDAEATTIPYADAAKITPKVTITKGDQTEANVKYEYKKQNAGDGTYTKVAPTEKGDYVVRATVAETDTYLGFEATAEFSISDKLQAEGTVATFNGELQTVEFMEAEGLVITPKMTYTVPEDAAEAEALDVTYTYKKAEASDSTYSDKQPTEIGEYTVRAVVAETDKYVGFTATANFKITEDPDKAEAEAKAAAIKSAEEDVLKRLQDTYETLKSSNKYSEGELAALEAAYNQSVKDIKAAIDDIANDGTVTKSTEVPEKAEALLKAAKGDLQNAVDAQSKNEAADKAVADAVANANTVLAAAEDALNNENAIQEDKDKVTEAKQTVEAAKLAAEAAETNDAKNEAAKALKDAVDTLDSAVDESNLHAAIAEAVMNQENIQPFVKKVATDSLKEYAERVKPDDLNEEEATAFNKALEDGKAAIEAASNNEEILGTDEQPGILAQQKDAVKAAADAINETRAANAAKEAAKVVAEMAEAAADDAKANEYASDEDKKAIDDAKEALAGAMETLDAAETNEAKNAAAEAVEKAAKALEDATDKANANSATAKAQAEAEAAAKEAAEKALADAKTDAKKAIEALYDAKNLSDYRPDQQKELAAAKEAGDKAIDAAKTTDEVATELAAAKKAINAVKTDSAKTKEEDAAKKAADAAAAKAATDKINAISTPVTTNSKGAIDAARAAYNALTADQKKLVSNNVVKKLTDAEATYNALVSPYDPVDTSKLTVNSATGSAKNGSIEGVDSTMQYSLDGKSWTDIADGATSITGFAAGKVYLRRKADSAHAASKAVTVTIKKINPSKPNFYSLLLHQHQVKKTSTILTWTKVAGAKKYVVYGGKYGAKMKKITSTTKNKVTRKGLKAGTMYNFYVVAIDAQGLRICTSDTVYIATKGGKLTNHKKITTSVSGKSTTISVGGTLNLNAKVTKESSKLQIKKINGLKYASTNPSIAKVSKKGVITGVKKGTCYVYVYAQNGVYKKIKVTVQ